MRYAVGGVLVVAVGFIAYRLYQAQQNGVPLARALAHPSVTAGALRQPGDALGYVQRQELMANPEARRGAAHFNG